MDYTSFAPGASSNPKIPAPLPDPVGPKHLPKIVSLIALILLIGGSASGYVWYWQTQKEDQIYVPASASRDEATPFLDIKTNSAIQPNLVLGTETWNDYVNKDGGFAIKYPPIAKVGECIPPVGYGDLGNCINYANGFIGGLSFVVGPPSVPSKNNAYADLFDSYKKEAQSGDNKNSNIDNCAVYNIPNSGGTVEAVNCFMVYIVRASGVHRTLYLQAIHIDHSEKCSAWCKTDYIDIPKGFKNYNELKMALETLKLE